MTRVVIVLAPTYPHTIEEVVGSFKTKVEAEQWEIENINNGEAIGMKMEKPE